MTEHLRIKVVLAMVGIDSMDRGLRAVSRGLMDAGMEVIYLGYYNTPEKIVATALQEDADVIGLSFLAGGHISGTAKVIGGLEESGLRDVMVLVGGVIPMEDVAKLTSMGVSRVFTSGTKVSEIAEFIRARRVCE